MNSEAEARGWTLRYDGECVFAHQALNGLRDLWLSVGGGAVPARAALDMRTLKPYARNVTILEKTGDGYRFRLFGSALAQVFGEHTGQMLKDMVLPEMLPGWMAFYDAVLAGRRPLRLINYYRLPNGGFLKGEIFAAPLADEAGEIRLVLAATYVDLKDYTLSPFSPAGPLT